MLCVVSKDTFSCLDRPRRVVDSCHWATGARSRLDGCAAAPSSCRVSAPSRRRSDLCVASVRAETGMRQRARRSKQSTDAIFFTNPLFHLVRHHTTILRKENRLCPGLSDYAALAAPSRGAGRCPLRGSLPALERQGRAVPRIRGTAGVEADRVGPHLIWATGTGAPACAWTETDDARRHAKRVLQL